MLTRFDLTAIENQLVLGLSSTEFWEALAAHWASQMSDAEARHLFRFYRADRAHTHTPVLLPNMSIA